MNLGQYNTRHVIKHVTLKVSYNIVHKVFFGIKQLRITFLPNKILCKRNFFGINCQFGLNM